MPFATDKRHAWPRPLHNHIARTSLWLREELKPLKQYDVPET